MKIAFAALACLFSIQLFAATEIINDQLHSATSQSIASGTTGAAIAINSRIAAITAVPGASGSMTVQYSTSLPSQVAAGTANWIAWPTGSVSSAISDSPVAPITAVRASAVTSTGTLEVVQ